MSNPWLEAADRIKTAVDHMFNNCPVDKTRLVRTREPDGIVKVRCARRFFPHTWYDEPENIESYKLKEALEVIQWKLRKRNEPTPPDLERAIRDLAAGADNCWWKQPRRYVERRVRGYMLGRKLAKEYEWLREWHPK